MKYFAFIFSLLLGFSSLAQPDRWQQRVEYKMEIDFDVKTHKFTGKQSLVYYNNSPDRLEKVFYHLYFNAFQPGSMMDIRSQTILDSDPRVGARISKLSPSEIGYHKIISLKQDGKPVKYEVVGTILEVTLNKSIAPNSQVVFDMEFESQVPVQVRRSGRDNREGIDYSMAQWYPKLCEYDYQGWHANPYIAREFYGVWGDFDVKISIDKNYTIGGTGYLQNPNEIGHGYQDKAVTPERTIEEKLTWHFVAPNVHDFVWAADPDYKHTRHKTKQGVMLHFFYQENERTKEHWEALPEIMDAAQTFMDKQYGAYPYKQYSFIQAGDGGMEYPMATLITGERSLSSLVGVSIHEWFHSWYQMVLGTNESLYAWMDEGFTEFGETHTKNYLRGLGLLPGSKVDNPFSGVYRDFRNFALSGHEEPSSVHADHFSTNYAYAMSAYTKGNVFLNQLEYVIGKNDFDRAMLVYYNTWKFKHPNPNDFIRVMEKVSGLELDWYREYFINTTHLIDYGIQSVSEHNAKETRIVLAKRGGMPMPMDIVVTEKNGDKTLYYIPLRIMRGEKGDDRSKLKRNLMEDWPWTHPTYELIVPCKIKNILKVEIDPSKRIMDVDPENDVFQVKHED